MQMNEKAVQAFHQELRGHPVHDAAAYEAAIRAYLSALLPEDAAGLVERLRKPWDGSPGCRDRRDAERAEAATLIQSQAARNGALEDALAHVTELLVDTWHVVMPSDNDPEQDIAVMAARSLLNKDAK